MTLFSNTSKALIWAAIIICAALFAASFGLSQNAAFGITSGLTAAAWGSIQSGYHGRSVCSLGGLQ